MTVGSDVPLASLALLRRITDRHVVDQLLGTATMTRAEIAAATGISKPTVSESVRRLERDGILVEAGLASTGRRGPAGLYYALRPDLGVALAVDASPDGLVAEVLDVRGAVLRRAERSSPSPVSARTIAPILNGLVEDATAGAPGPVRACFVSAAGPVDRASGRLVHLPHSPFVLDELDVRGLLEAAVGCSVEVDNDVNWAALAEHDTGVAAGLADFCYLHLGHGLGGAVVQSGRLVRGHTGLAGEPAHMVTMGAGGRAVRLVECFGQLGLLRHGSDAIDVARILEVLRGDSPSDRKDRAVVVEAVGGVLSSMAALLNPAVLVIGGPWAGAEDFVPRLAEHAATRLVPPTRVAAAELGGSAPLIGARLAAVRALRAGLFNQEQLEFSS